MCPPPAVLLALALRAATVSAAGDGQARFPDLKDPFRHAAPGRRATAVRAAGPDLKDPFAPPAPGRRSPTPGPARLVSDLKDPFDHTPPCAAVPRVVRVDGRSVPVQRPRRAGARCRTRAPAPSGGRTANRAAAATRDLRDPFADEPSGR